MWWVQAAWRQEINLDTISRFLVFSSHNEQELWLLYRNSGRGLFRWCQRLLYDDLLHISESDTRFVTVLNPQGQRFNEVFIVAVQVQGCAVCSAIWSTVQSGRADSNR